MNHTIFNEELKKEFVQQVKAAYWDHDDPVQEAYAFYNIINWVAGVVGVKPSEWEVQ